MLVSISTAVTRTFRRGAEVLRERKHERLCRVAQLSDGQGHHDDQRRARAQAGGGGDRRRGGRSGAGGDAGGQPVLPARGDDGRGTASPPVRRQTSPRRSRHVEGAGPKRHAALGRRPSQRSRRSRRRRPRAGAANCHTAAIIAAAANQVRAAFASYAHLDHMDFPGEFAGWLAEQSASDSRTVSWHLSQRDRFELGRDAVRPGRAWR